ncbi:MAG: ATPase [Prevotella sp.]|nr:ATPase [Bacteroides sp.]MCM1366062.1 ATPase [Prevotella sp.]MCM1436547.1 ATPase [Prevotella sp.]
MKIKLIADAGSTKVEWVLLDSNGIVKERFVTEGLNALLSSKDDILKAFQEVNTHIGNTRPELIYYYGAGCATDLICSKISDALIQTWPEASTFVSSDLLGAARALFQDKPGIACILGTGSNSCHYNGYDIETNVPSLGYVLGDEGSGASLGKRLVADAFKLRLPEVMREKFLDQYGLSLSDILDKVYRCPAPNKFLASLVPFIKENLWNPYIYSLVYEELTHFVKRNIAMYSCAHSLAVGFTGSIAYHFSDILREAVSAQGYEVSTVSKSPIDGLILYHTSHDGE